MSKNSTSNDSLQEPPSDLVTIQIDAIDESGESQKVTFYARPKQNASVFFLGSNEDGSVRRKNYSMTVTEKGLSLGVKGN